MSGSLRGRGYGGLTYALLVENFGRFLIIATPWALPVLAVTLWPLAHSASFRAVLTPIAIWAAGFGPGAFESMFVMFIAIVFLLTSVGFMVEWHREILRNSVTPSIGFGQAYARYLGYVFLSGCFVLAVTVPVGLAVYFSTRSNPGLSTLTAILLVGATLVAIGGLLHCTLVLPSAALRNDIGIRRSIELLRGNFWRVVGGTLAATLPMSFASRIWERVIGGMAFFAEEPAGIALHAIVGVFLAFLGSGLVVTYQSVLYAHFVDAPIPMPPEWIEPDPSVQ